MTFIILFDLVASILAKYYDIKQAPVFLLLSMLACSMTGLFLAKSLRFEGLAITNIIWNSLSAITVTISGYILFGEKLGEVQIIGIFIAMLGIALINM